MKKNKKKGLLAILSPVKSTIFKAMALNSLGVIFSLLGLVFLSFSLTALARGEKLVLLGFNFNLLDTILVLTFLLFGGFLSKGFSFLVSHYGAFRLESILRKNISTHLAKVPLGFINTKGSGALKKIMQDDVKNLHAFVADSTPMLSRSIISPILTLVILFLADWRLALASMSVLAVGFFAMSFAMQDHEYYRSRYEQAQQNINKAVVEFIQAMPVVRTFEDGSSSFKRYKDSLDDYRHNINEWMDKGKTSGRLGMVILTPLPTLIMVFLTAIGLKTFFTLELSSFMLVLFLSTGLADAMMPLMWMNQLIKKSQTSAFAIHELLNTQELKQSKNPKKPKNYDISFKDVSFAYTKGGNLAIENINLNIPSGSVCALVGSSGSGKSTIAKLIPRFWDVTKGEIKIGEINVKDMAFEDLMNTVSFVFQDTFLFDESIRDNIALAKTDASDEEIQKSAKAAMIHDFILTLPKGYDTKAGDRGTKLSGGQKQRITIARAILRDAPIIILDEATAFADPENEEEIVHALANLTKGKTVLIIAHRLSTIKDVEQIIVLDKGRVSERGNHQELLEKNGSYAKLWNYYKRAEKWSLEGGKA